MHNEIMIRNPNLDLSVPALNEGGWKSSKAKHELWTHWESILKSVNENWNKSMDEILKDNLASYFAPKFKQEEI